MAKKKSKSSSGVMGMVQSLGDAMGLTHTKKKRSTKKSAATATKRPTKKRAAKKK